MKKSAMIVCLLLVLSLLAGCLKDEVGGVRLSNDEPVEMYSVPRQVAVMLFHTGGAWTASTDATWLKIKKESGPGGTDTLVIITTEKNLTGAPRTAQVTVESGGQRELVTVRQSEEYAIFDPKEIVMPAEGGTLDVSFRTNVADSLQLYVSAHLVEHLVDTRKEQDSAASRADKTGSLEWLRVEPNDSSAERSGYFFLSINSKFGGRIDLDTLKFTQLTSQKAAEPDSTGQ